MFDQELYENNVENLNKVVNVYQKDHLFVEATPMTVSFLVTDRCCLRCKHCFNNRTRKEEFERARNELTIDEIGRMSKSMGHFSSALLCGGEPFLRDDLHEIVKTFRMNNQTQWFSSSTNGQLTDRIIKQMELISRQYKHHRYTMNFSFEGFEQENDEVRGKGTFQKSIETWKECKRLNAIYGNISQNIVVTMNSINQATLPAFFKWAQEHLQPERIMMLLVRQAPRAGAYLKEVDIKNYEAAKDILNSMTLNGENGDCNSPLGYIPAAQYYYTLRTLRTGKRTFMCYAGKHGVFIDYDGEVNPCEVLADGQCNNEPISMGNLRDYDMDFAKLWNSKPAQDVKQLVNRHEVCKDCTHETEGILPSVYFEPNFFGRESTELI